MLIRGAELEGRAPVDVRLGDGRVVEIGAALARRHGEEVLEARGGALLPGLHDHHLHLMSLAAARNSVACGPPQVDDADALRSALAAASASRGWVRGVGYHESVAGPLDRHALDGLAPGRRVRVQHRSGSLWIVSSAGVAALGLDAGADAPGVERDAQGRATGRLFRLDRWLRERIAGGGPPDLAPVGRALARVGVTGVTDATPDNGREALAVLEAAVSAGALPQHVRVMGRLDLPRSRLDRVERGALKLLVDERDLPAPDGLAATVARAHRTGRAVAVHCVTRAEIVVALAAFEEAGVLEGDRLEHASVAPPDAVALAAALGLSVVTQPGFLHERGDAYARDVDPADAPWLYRGRGWIDAGVPLGGATDAPFGTPDPWLAMRAAVDRTSRGGRRLGPGESLTPERALALFTTSLAAPGGPARRVQVGVEADLCLLYEPWAAVRLRPSSGAVAATFCRGVRVDR